MIHIFPKTLNRLQYLIRNVIFSIVFCAIVALLTVVLPDKIAHHYAPYCAVIIIATVLTLRTIALDIPRIKNMGYSPWLLLFLLVPIVDFILQLILCLAPPHKFRQDAFINKLLQNKWGFFFCCLLSVLPIFLVMGCYFEENWRGANEWNLMKNQIEAEGDSFDISNYLPKKISDEQNMAAIPLFQRQYNNAAHQWERPALRDAVDIKKILNDPEAKLPAAGNFSKGEFTDVKKIDEEFAAFYIKLFPGNKVPDSTLEKMDAIIPALKEIREAARTRTECYLEEDFTTQPPQARNYPDMLLLMDLEKYLHLHAVLAIHENQPDIAIEDFKVAMKFSTTGAQQPSLIWGLISQAYMGLQIDTIWEGINQHSWNDQQIAEIQKILAGVDCLKTYQLNMHGEEDFIVHEFDSIRDMIQGRNDISDIHDPAFSSSMERYSWMIPCGWLDMGKSRCLFDYNEAIHTHLDTEKRRVYPKLIKISAESFRLRACSTVFKTFYPPDIFERLNYAKPITLLKKSSESQCDIDMAIIACALERYRLTNGRYPETFDALTPYSENPRPNDLFSGKPYCYKLLTKDQFLLYSIGWDEVDDGGKIVYQTGILKSIDKEQGDWVWPPYSVENANKD